MLPTPRSFALLLLALGALDLATYSAIVPLLGDYQARLGVSDAEIGLLVASYSVAVVVVSIPAGRAADRFGARRITLASIGLYAVANVGFALADGYGSLLLARVGQGCGSGVAWSAGLAWLTSRTAPDERAAAIGRMTAGASLGLIAGPLLGGAVGGAIGVREAFIVLALASALLLALLARHADGPSATDRDGSLRAGVAIARRSAPIRLSILLSAVVGTVGGALQTLLPLDLDAAGMSESAIGALFGLSAAGAAAISLLGGRLGHLRRLVLAAGAALALLAGASAILATSPPSAAIAVLLVVQGAVQSVVYIAAFTLASVGAELAAVGYGLVMGVVNLVWGLATVAGPVVGGGVSAATSAAVAYLAAAILTAGSIAIPLRAARSRRCPSTGDGALGGVI